MLYKRICKISLFSKHYCQWKSIARKEACPNEAKNFIGRTARRFISPSDEPENESRSTSNKIEILNLDEEESIQEIISKLKSFDKLTYFGFVVENGKGK